MPTFCELHFEAVDLIAEVGFRGAAQGRAAHSDSSRPWPGPVCLTTSPQGPEGQGRYFSDSIFPGPWQMVTK